MERPEFITKPDWNELVKIYDDLEPIVKKIKKGYPVQYLIGYVDFYHTKISVDENVLIPRFETEELVEKVVNKAKEMCLDPKNIIDEATGSGCIAIALKKVFKNASVKGIDISTKALEVAKKNAWQNEVEVEFKKMNITKKLKDKYDIIISNPPYIAYNEKISSSVKKYEPSLALYANDEGTYFYKYMLKNNKNNLNKPSIMAFEIGWYQGDILKKIASKYYKESKIEILKDLEGKDRFLFIITE